MITTLHLLLITHILSPLELMFTEEQNLPARVRNQWFGRVEIVRVEDLVGSIIVSLLPRTIGRLRPAYLFRTLPLVGSWPGRPYRHVLVRGRGGFFGSRWR
jgi:hypothetical protein